MELIFDNVYGSGEIQFDVLKAICGDTNGKSMIDLGSGECLQTKRLGFKDKFFIDIVDRDLGEENANFLQRDILEFIELIFPLNLDISFSLDNIEHFWEEDGRKVIKWMEDNSRKQILFTPIGYYMNIWDKENKDPDMHRSGWTPEMLPDYAHIVFPKFHPTLSDKGLGAFFAFKCDNLEEEFKRVTNELKNKSWAN